jgi:hypothetical protein
MTNCETCAYHIDERPFCTNPDIANMITGLMINNRETWTQITDRWKTDGSICSGYEDKAWKVDANE